MPKSISVLIVDDEPLARQKLKRLLSDQHSDFEIHSVESGLLALDFLEQRTPDIIFLDIEMPSFSGFEFLYHLTERPFKVIFQTAYDEFAVKAFEENACDYILKPFTPERLEKAISKAIDQINSDHTLKGLEKNLIEHNDFLSSIGVKDNGVFQIISADDIDCLISRDHYTCVMTGSREYLTKLSLDHLASRMNPDQFIRTHRSAIINAKQIKSFNGTEIETKQGHRVEVSRRNKARISQYLKKR